MSTLKVTVVGSFDFEVEVDESLLPDTYDKTRAGDVLKFAREQGMVDLNKAKLFDIKMLHVKEMEE